MAISEDYQFEYENGAGDTLLMGAGTDYDITDLRGFGIPPVRANDIPRLDQIGSITSRKELMNARSINMRVIVYGDPGDTLDARVTALKKVIQPNDLTGKLKFRFPVGWGSSDTVNDDRFITVYVRKLTQQILASNSAGRIPMFISFEAPDPRINGAEENSESIALSTFTGGATFNATFNLSFGTGVSGTVTLNNAGNFKANPVVRFNGPLTDPKLTNSTASSYVELAGLTLGAGEYVDIDFRERSILKGGSTSVYNKLTNTSTWWTLAPGDNNLVFSAASSSSTTCTVTYHDTWI